MFSSDTDFTSIETTALVTSYPRTLTDIPYEKEIFAELQKKETKDIPLQKELAPSIEARYKLINKLIEQKEANQVLELAAGYSSRGLNFALCGKTFIEMDLESISKNKTAILQSIVKELPNNLHILTGNALNTADYEQCRPFLDKHKKLAVITEGLLRYLSFDEKKIVAENIFALLSEFSGVWITCDITPKAYIKSQRKHMPHWQETLSTLTPRSSLNNIFEDKDHITDFFSKVGFDTEFHPFSEIKESLYSPKILGYNQEKVDSLLENALVAVFKIKRGN